MTSSSPPIPLVGLEAALRPAAAEPTGRPRLQRIRRKGADRSGDLLDDQWELLRRVGFGGMAEVYHAVNHVDRRPYAVKILSSKYAADPSAYDRFRHEFMVLRRAAHPHIVAAHAFVERAGECFYSMELLGGEPLSRMTDPGPLEPERVVLLGLQLCAAIGHLHDLGVIHRDIKPNNIIVTRENGRDHAKILDLGICKLTPRWYANLDLRTDVDMRLHTQTDAPLGTPGYMINDGDVADEVLKDVFGLGVTLFRIATGHLPYKKSPPKVGDELQWTEADEERIPEALATVLRKAVALDPTVRYQAVTGDPAEITLLSELVQAGMEMGVIPCEDAEGSSSGSTSTLSSPRTPEVPLALVPPRRSMGWIVAAILGLYMVVDLVSAHFGAEVDGPVSERASPAVEHPGDGPSLSMSEGAGLSPDSPPSTPAAPAEELPEHAAASTSTIEVAEVAEEEPPPRPRRHPLTPAAFRKIALSKRAALARCERWLRGGPAVDVIVRVSAEGVATGVTLSPDVSSLAQVCAAEVFESLPFPRAGADSTHTWPLYRPEEKEG